MWGNRRRVGRVGNAGIPRRRVATTVLACGDRCVKDRSPPGYACSGPCRTGSELGRERAMGSVPPPGSHRDRTRIRRDPGAIPPQRGGSVRSAVLGQAHALTCGQSHVSSGANPKACGRACPVAMSRRNVRVGVRRMRSRDAQRARQSALACRRRSTCGRPTRRGRAGMPERVVALRRGRTRVMAVSGDRRRVKWRLGGVPRLGAAVHGGAYGDETLGPVFLARSDQVSNALRHLAGGVPSRPSACSSPGNDVPPPHPRQDRIRIPKPYGKLERSAPPVDGFSGHPRSGRTVPGAQRRHPRSDWSSRLRRRPRHR